MAYGPLTAQYALLSARLSEATGDFRSSIALLHQAAIAAEAWNDTESLFRAWTALVRVQGVAETKHDEGTLYGQYAAAALQRTARTPALEAELLSVLGVLEREKGRYPEAIVHEKGAIELLTQAFGPNHPRVGRALHALAWTESWAGDQQTATKHSRLALEILKASFGTHHPAVAQVLAELGSIEDELGDFESAVAHLEEGLAIREALYGPVHADVAASHNLIALTYSRVGRLDEASASAEHALSFFRRTLGDHRLTGKVLHTLGDVRLAQQRPAEALVVLEESLKMERVILPRDSLDLGYTLTSLGEAHLRLREPKRALPPLEEAIKLRDGREQLPLEIGKTRSALARALLATNGDPSRAKALAAQAHETSNARGRKACSKSASSTKRFPRSR